MSRLWWRSSGRGRAVGALTAGGVLAALVGVPAHAAAAAPTDPAPAVAWADCGGGFECGTVEVPLDYAQPAAGTTAVGVIRLPASDPQRRIGSLLVNPGGPGGSGVQFVRQAARFVYSEQLRARFDIVGFDPRGVGTSGELRCFRDVAEQRAFWGDLPAFPVTREQERATIERTSNYSRLCGERNRRVLPHVSTVDVARDMDRLRAAVGDQQLTFVGYSYGSYLGEVYANLFPNRVRAVALDGVLDPQTWANQTLLFPPEAAHGGELGLDAFATSCAAAGPACSFARGDSGPRVRQRLDAILAGIRQRPLPAPAADPPGDLDYWLANGAYLISMYDTLFWPTFASGLAGAEAGDGSVLLDLIRLFLAPPDVYDNSGDVFSAVFCTDGTFPRVPELWPPLTRLAERRAPTFSRYWMYSALPCASWPARAPQRYAGPWDRPTAAPILMLNTVADPATPLAGAIRAQRRMADARLVTLDGWGHTTLAHQSTCVQQVLERYLVDRVAPPDGLRCAPDAGPFPAAATVSDRVDVRTVVPWLPRLG